MAEHHSSVEAEEQIDLEGDNDIEDMMDDEDPVDDYPEDTSYVEDRGYRKARDVYTEDDGYRKVGDQSSDEEHGSEGEDPDKVASRDVANDPSSSSKDEDDPVGLKDEVDSEKHAELLALPPHGSEVFIGGVPRDATEEELRELCEPLGESCEVKLVKDKDSKENKGFAFITFLTKDAAQKAIEEIHDKEFKGRTLRCSLSQTKYRLFIGNIPKSLTDEEVTKILEDTGPGVENVECFKDPQNPSRNRGFLFVEYYNNACAEYSRQKMTSADFNLDGSKPTVTWAEPKNSSDSSAVGQVKAIYLKNLPENVTQEKLKELFERHGEITKVVLPPSKSGQKRDFGFIHFAERSSALKAVKGTEKYEIDGQVVEATLAKPQSEKKHDHASNSNRPGLLTNHPQYPPYSYSGDPYGAYGAGYGAGRGSQPVIYGRGPMPSGMRMVPMYLPDGRLGYVLQQPGGQATPPPPRRGEYGGGGSSDSGGRSSSDGSRNRRYRPY